MINMHKIAENSKTIGEVLKFEFPVQIFDELNSNITLSMKGFLENYFKKKKVMVRPLIPSLYPEEIPNYETQR